MTMTVNKVLRLLEELCDWCFDGEFYDYDIEARIVQLHSDAGNKVPLYELEVDDGYGGYEPLYYWPNGHPTRLGEHADVDLEKYGLSDREGVVLTRAEYLLIAEYLPIKEVGEWK